MSAWQWLNDGCGLDVESGTPARHRFDASLFSRLMLPGLIVRNASSEEFSASLGHGSWAALVWPLKQTSCDESGMRTFELDVRGTARWVYVTDPSQWRVVPYIASRSVHGIRLKQVEAEQPLAKAVLQSKALRNFENFATCFPLCKSKRRMKASLESSNAYKFLTSLCSCNHVLTSFVNRLALCHSRIFNG